MKITDFVAVCTAKDFEPDAEILVEREDGMLHDFDLVETEASFDGFDGYFPEGLKIVIKNN